MCRKFIVASLALLITGCVSGMDQDGDYPSETFNVLIGYQEAYRRADAQMRYCGNDSGMAGNLYTDNKTAILRLTYHGLVTVAQERVEIRALNDSATEV